LIERSGSNSEDSNFVMSSEVAATYAKYWPARQSVSIRFTVTSEWFDE
jgi:hypothetical protein